jgi:curved DNA-binding protein CbpA
VAELTRGTVFDRPWGRTLGSLGLRGLTGQLTLTALDGKSYEIAFSHGAVIGASSPIASDAAVRVALTGGLISTTQVAELARKQATQAGRDEIEVISDHLRLGFDQAMRLRRRTIAQRAARSFSVDKGDFVVTDEITLPSVAGSELDIRAIIYIGARQNLSEVRLASELGLFGTWFRLKPEAFEDLPQFGFADQERPIIDQLMNGASLGDLEAIVGIDVRQVRATLYALCAANACNVEQARGQGTTKPPPPSMKTDPNLRRSTGSQPPLSKPPEQPPARPGSSPPTGRERRPSNQPLVAYRPGMRRTGTTQPPPLNTTQTLRESAPDIARASPREIDANRPMGAAGNTMPPANARRATTTPPAGTEILQQPGVRSTGSNPGISRTTTGPAVARTSTPVPMPRTTTPARSRTITPIPPRTLTTPPSTPPLSRTQTPVSGPTRTLTTPVPTSRTASASQVPRTRTPSKLPGMQAPEVMALITERARQLESGADHYEMLGVSTKATGDDIRKTYFNLARSLHPDRLSALGIEDDTRIAHKVFAQLNMAFSVLSDHKRRADYDDLLGHGGETVQREQEARAEEIALRILASEEHYKKGEMALKRDDLGTAIAELAKAVELNPDEADFAATHTWAIFCATPEKATIGRQTRAALEKAVQRSPKAITPRFYLGRVHRMLGNDKEALDLFREILQDKPHHHEAQSEIRAIETRLAGPPKGGGLFGKKR